MSREQVEQVRAASRSKDKGPWVEWWGEMAKKTVLRRLMKRLPTSADLDDLIRRDDALYDFEGARDEARKIQSGGSLADRMKALAAPSPRLSDAEQKPSALEARLADVRDRHPSGDSVDPDTGEIIQHPNRGDLPAAMSPEDSGADTVVCSVEASGSSSSEGDDFPGDRPSREELIDRAHQQGAEARSKGVKRRALPGEYRDDDELAQAWELGWDEATGAAA